MTLKTNLRVQKFILNKAGYRLLPIRDFRLRYHEWMRSVCPQESPYPRFHIVKDFGKKKYEIHLDMYRTHRKKLSGTIISEGYILRKEALRIYKISFLDYLEKNQDIPGKTYKIKKMAIRLKRFQNGVDEFAKKKRRKERLIL